MLTACGRTSRLPGADMAKFALPSGVATTVKVKGCVNEAPGVSVNVVVFENPLLSG